MLQSYDIGTLFYTLVESIKEDLVVIVYKTPSRRFEALRIFFEVKKLASLPTQTTTKKIFLRPQAWLDENEILRLIITNTLQEGCCIC